VNNVVLIGFMGSGKSSVGQLLAQRLKRAFIDLDERIVADAGRPVSRIFAEEGEGAFRARESRCLLRALTERGRLIAVGGGAPLPDRNWEAIRQGNCVVGLLADRDELVRRLEGSTHRPLLEPDLRTAVDTLLPSRTSRYLQADLLVDTAGRSCDAVAAHIADRLPLEGLDRISVEIPGSEHEVILGSRLAPLLGPMLRRAGSAGGVVVVTDEVVGAAHGDAVSAALDESGLSPHIHFLPRGEEAKQLPVLTKLYAELSARGIDRAGALVALGGGTVGDVTGFAAATWLRGIPYVQMPTTLLAMVDSSIGGKTGINLPTGKNLVGAVYQPAAVLCDLDHLRTLSEADYRSALAEVIKAAIVADPPLFQWLAEMRNGILNREPALVGEVVRRSVAIKARIVAADPGDRGSRAILNYGHTVGHALERTMGYGTLRHGEAVAWGMQVAGRLSLLSGLCSPDTVQAQASLLAAYGLLDRKPRVSGTDLLAAMRHDKKSRQGEPRWVLLRDLGKPEFGVPVQRDHVESAIDGVLA
jgi:3-dehydroquinate synthase